MTVDVDLDERRSNVADPTQRVQGEVARVSEQDDSLEPTGSSM